MIIRYGVDVGVDDYTGIKCDYYLINTLLKGPINVDHISTSRLNLTFDLLVQLAVF